MTNTQDPTPDAGQARADALSRRAFLKGAGGVAAAGGVLQDSATAQAPPQDATTLSGTVEVTLNLNGAEQTVTVEPRTTLLATLRHHLPQPMTGSKEVCDRGNCGSCTVIVDGRPVYACMQLAVDAVGKRIRTVEGEGTPEAMSPVQAAFCKHDGLMCGFCTPGFVMATTAALEASPAADRAEIQRRLSGNLCRCGTYTHVFDAAEAARDELAGGARRKEDR